MQTAQGELGDRGLQNGFAAVFSRKAVGFRWMSSSHKVSVHSLTLFVKGGIGASTRIHQRVKVGGGVSRRVMCAMRREQVSSSSAGQRLRVLGLCFALPGSDQCVPLRLTSLLHYYFTL